MLRYNEQVLRQGILQNYSLQKIDIYMHVAWLTEKKIH